MTTAATSLLGLALPVTGELSGTWGDTVNNSITSLLDTAVAGTTTLSTDADVTLTTTTLASNQARQAILLCSGARTALRTITAPAQSKIYTIINATTGGYSIKLVGVGPTTGLTIPNGASAVVAWNGSDFIEVGSATVGNLTVNGNLSVTGTTSLTGVATLTANPVLSAGTANGVAYLNGSKVVTTGSALTFNGTRFSTYVTSDTNTNIARFGVVNSADTDDAFLDISADAANNLITLNSTGNNAGSFAFQTGNSEQMRLTSTGLGIGTSSPSTKLQVAKDSALSSTWDAAQLRITGATNTAYRLQLGYDTTNNYSVIQSVEAGVAFTNLLLNPLGGNVGIGTSSPGTKLDVQGTGNTTLRVQTNTSGNPILSLNAAGADGATVLYDRTGNALRFDISSITGAMYLNTSGNLGLGVTPSAWSSGYKAIQIAPYNYFAVAAQGSNACEGNLTWNAYSTGSETFAYKNTGDAASRFKQSNAFYWFTAPSGTAGDAISFTQAMTLDASGNLGVGTTTINNRITIGDSGTGLGFSNAASGNFNIGLLAGTGSANAYIFQRANADLLFGTNNTERARIDSSGNLLVGTTSSTTTPANGVQINNPTTNSTVAVGHASGTASGNYYVNFGYAGTSIGNITQSGTTAVLYNVTSDQRLKENIQDADDSADLVDSLQVRQFDWKADGNHQRYGFIAQELVQVAPEAVHQPDNPDDMMAVDYSKLVPMLVKELQSLRKRVAQLEGQ